MDPELREEEEGTVIGTDDIYSNNCAVWENDGVGSYYFDSGDNGKNIGYRKPGKSADEKHIIQPWYKVVRRYYLRLISW